MATPKASVVQAAPQVTDTELLAIFDTVSKQTIWTITLWDQYLTLFADDKCKGVMQEGYGSFSGLLQNILYRDVVLRIARLLDVAQTRKSKNATLLFLEEFGDSEKLESFRKILAEIKAKSEEITVLRNKVLAHADAETALNRVSPRYPDPTEITKTLRLMSKAVCEFHNSYHSSSQIMMPLAEISANKLLHNAQWAELGRARCEAAIDQNLTCMETDAMQPTFIYPDPKSKDWYK